MPVATAPAERNEVKNTIGREIRFVVRIEWLQNPTGEKVAKFRVANCRRHHEAKDKIRNREPECSPRANERSNGWRPAEGDPAAEARLINPDAAAAAPRSIIILPNTSAAL
jgi:hypothetical protein